MKYSLKYGDNVLSYAGLITSPDYDYDIKRIEIGTEGLSSSNQAIFAHNNKVLIGGSTGYVFLSLDYGETFSNIVDKLVYNVRANSLYISDTLMIVGSHTGDLFISTNNGISFTNYKSTLSTNTITCVYAKGNEIFIGATISGGNALFRSTNNGSTFTNITSSIQPSVSATFKFVREYQGNYILSGTGLKYSSDGVNYNNTAIPGTNYYDCVYGDTIFMCGNGGTLLKGTTLNNMIDITYKLIGLRTSPVPTLLTIDSTYSSLLNDNIVVVGGTDTALYISYDNGETFQNMLPEYFMDRIGSVESISISDNNIFILTDQQLYKGTLKNIQDFEIETFDLSDKIDLSNNARSLSNYNNNIIYCSGNGINLSTIQRSTDNGVTFTNIGTYSTPIRVSGIYEDKVIIGLDGALLSTNSGSTFTDITSKLTGVTDIRGVGIYESTIILGGSNGKIYLSTNNGSTFTEINSRLTGLSTTRITAISIHTNTIVVGCESGKCYLSTDNGTTFSYITDTIGITSHVRSVAVYKNHIIICSHSAESRMFYLSTNKGVSFTLINDRLRENDTFSNGSVSIYDNIMVITGGTNDVFISKDYGLTFKNIVNSLLYPETYNNISYQYSSVHKNNIYVATSSSSIRLNKVQIK
jgi:photosystem II stability/assembly factor-like uncharacterized protein